MLRSGSVTQGSTERTNCREGSLVVDVLGGERAIVFAIVPGLVRAVFFSLGHALAAFIATGHFLHHHRPCSLSILVVNPLGRLGQIVLVDRPLFSLDQFVETVGFIGSNWAYEDW